MDTEDRLVDVVRVEVRGLVGDEILALATATLIPVVGDRVAVIVGDRYHYATVTQRGWEIRPNGDVTVQLACT